MEHVDVSGVVEELRARGIDVVRVSYPDLIGVDRGRDVLIDELPNVMGHGIAFCRAIYHTSPRGDVVAVQGGLESGLPDIAAHPDLSTLTDLPWEPGAAWCLADTTSLGDPAMESPRGLARHVSARLGELGLSAIIGPELEFYVLEPDDTCDRGWKRYADEPGNVYVVGRKGDPRGVLLTMLRFMRDAQLQVTAANHEFSPGQFEINLNHSELLDAADRAFRMKSAVQEIARHQGLLATFMAKPFDDEGGSGFHLHLSLVDTDGANVFGDPEGPDGLSQTGRSAIAGVLAHAPALAALLNPTINSYKRFGPDTLAPWLIDWGMDNRSAMVRIPPERGGAARMEVRLGDATANPYIAMAAVTAAVYLGVRDKLEPSAPLEGYGYDPESAAMLPQSLPEALDALEADTELVEVLGEFFVNSFLTYKRNEVERFSRSVTDWEFREYAYRRTPYAVPVTPARSTDLDEEHVMTDTVTGELAAPLADPDSFVDGSPWELFRTLRDTEPVAWTPEPDDGSGFWSVTRHADIVAVSRDWEAFTSSRGVSLEDLEDDQLEHRTSLIDTDPPNHAAMRKIVSGMFLPRVVNGYEAFLRGIVATTLDNALPLGSFDFVEKVSSEIPVRVLARMLSVPDTDHARLTAWGDRLVGGTDPEFADHLPGTPEYEEYRLVPFRSPAALEVFEYGRALQAERRAAPTDDIISRLVEAEVDGEKLSQQDLDNYFLLLALAGQETTRQALTLAMNTLIENPEALARLQSEPELLSGPALDELLRWGPPVYHMRRTATRDAVIGETAVAAGDKIAMWFPSGNRDERAIENPDVLDLDRPTVDLLTFGKGGPHFCMGSFLAKLEYRVTLEELVARLDTASFGGPVERLRSNFVNGIKRMPVTVTTR